MALESKRQRTTRRHIISHQDQHAASNTVTRDIAVRYTFTTHITIRALFNVLPIAMTSCLHWRRGNAFSGERQKSVDYLSSTYVGVSITYESAKLVQKHLVLQELS